MIDFVMLYVKGKVIWVLLFLSTSYYAKAQAHADVADKKWLLSIGGVVSKEILIDNNFSAVTYSGFNPGALVSAAYQQSGTSHEFEFYYSTGNLKPALDHIQGVKNTYFNFDYNNLYSIGSPKGSVECKVGGSLNVLYASRQYQDFINNNSSFEFTASLGAAASVAWFINDKLCIADRVNIPFITSVTQPAFGSNNAIGDLTQSGLSVKDIFNRGRLASFNSFLRIKNVLSLEENISGRQKILLNYTWDYYQLSHERRVKQANHRLGLTYCFIL